MARYKGAVCRLCRREGAKLFLKGDRCYGEKCSMSRRPYAPGQHGQRRKKVQDYGIRLREKQKAKRIYGMLERQFRNYFKKADKSKGVTGENLLRLLERRLDNVVFRSGFAASRNEARQLVNHGHFVVNGRKVDIPSFLVKSGDELEIREKSRKIKKISESVETAKSRGVPEWLQVEPDNYKSVVLNIPTREQIVVEIQEHLIVELYSK